jgi:hypothetical protein
VENGRPVSLAFSIDAMLLTSLVDLRRLGADIDTVDKVSDKAVQSWLDANCDVKKDGMSLTQVHALISKKLNINMAEKDTEQRIVMLFTDYSSLLRMNGLSWIVKDCPKIAIGHILETLKPKPLQTRVRGDLELGHTHLKKDFLKFMEHTIKRAEVYSDYEEPSQISSARSSGTDTKGSGSSRAQTISPSRDSVGKKNASQNQTAKDKPKQLPDCLNPSCSEKHFLKNCSFTSQERKDELYAQRAQARKTNGEQRVTCADNDTQGARREVRRRHPRQKPKEMPLLSRYDLRQMSLKEDYVYRLAMTKSTWRYRTSVPMTIRYHTLC